MMNSIDMKPKLIEFAEKIGLQPRLVASTESGEYHSSCPQCGGKNRFIIQPNRQAKNGVIPFPKIKIINPNQNMA